MKFQEIGSNFYCEELHSVDVINTSLFYKKYSGVHYITFPSLGRHGLTLIIQRLNLRKKAALLPAFTCEEVIKPFIQAQYDITFFNSQLNLSINIEDFQEKIKKNKPSVILLHGYFGEQTFLSAKQIIDEAQKNGCIVIQDDTQTVFSDVENIDADFFIGSLRKWMNIPDGSFICSKKYEVKEPLLIHEEYVETLAKAFQLKSAYTQSMDLNTKTKYKILYERAQYIVDKNPTPYKMAPLSKGTFNTIDLCKMKKQRLDNYNYLFNRLSGQFKSIETVYQAPANNNICPFYFPVFVKNRFEFQKILSENDIFATIIWPKSIFLKNIDKNTEYIYKNIIGIPIDQRYNSKSMKRVMEVIKNKFL